MAIIDVTKLVAASSVAPEAWQSPAPPEMYFKSPIPKSAELDRILALPRRPMVLDGTDRAEAIIDMITERYSNGATQCNCARINPERHGAEGCISRLRLLQAIALWELSIVGGLLAPIGVGYGKTLIDLLAPFAFSTHAAAHGMPHGDQILCVLLLPPGLIQQLVGDYDYIGQHFNMPTMVVQGHPEFDRVNPGAPKLQVMAYSRLSRGEATTWMNTVNPHAIISDECHRLRALKTATTSRVDRYMREHPWCRMAAYSGSMTSKSIRDYAHISDWCLRKGSPLPTDTEVADDFAGALDPRPTKARDPGALLNGLLATGCMGPGDTLYRGFHRRLSETLGVVSSTQPAVDCELELIERKAPTVPHNIRDLIEQALGFVRPDGEEFATAMQAVECACQLACGFHYRWIFPHNEFPRDDQLVNDWLWLRKDFGKELRQKLKFPEEHLDSPQLCVYAAQRALGLRPKHKGLPEWASKTYLPWFEIKQKVQPESEPVYIDDFLARNALEWCYEQPGILWYQHTAFGKWVHQLSVEQGNPVPIFGGGKEAKLSLLGDPARGIRGEDGTRSVILSLKAHGTGTNGLQFRFWRSLYGTNPAAPDAWEQSLGRTHRAGQKAKKVQAAFYMHTDEMRRHVKDALRNAFYVQGTMGQLQKLRIGFPVDLEEQLEDEIDDEG